MWQGSVEPTKTANTATVYRNTERRRQRRSECNELVSRARRFVMRAVMVSMSLVCFDRTLRAQSDAQSE